MAGKKGKRLSPQVKKAIAEAGPDVTNTALAGKYKTSMQTIARWRSGSPTTGAKKAKTSTPSTKQGPGGVQVSMEGDFIVVKIPKKGVLKNLVAEVLG